MAEPSGRTKAAPEGGADPADGGAGFHDLLGLRVETISGDEGRATMDATECHLNRHGTVHGGALATLADAAMGAAVAAAGVAPATVEMKVTYLEPAEAGRLTAVARVRRRGSRITVVEAEITDAAGTDIALALATFTAV